MPDGDSTPSTSSGAWLPDPTGRFKLRWQRSSGEWTDHVYDHDGNSQTNPYSADPAPLKPKRKRRIVRWVVSGLLALTVVSGVLGALTDSDNGSDQSTEAESTADSPTTTSVTDDDSEGAPSTDPPPESLSSVDEGKNSPDAAPTSVAGYGSDGMSAGDLASASDSSDAGSTNDGWTRIGNLELLVVGVEPYDSSLNNQFNSVNVRVALSLRKVAGDEYDVLFAAVTLIDTSGVGYEHDIFCIDCPGMIDETVLYDDLAAVTRYAYFEVPSLSDIDRLRFDPSSFTTDPVVIQLR